MDNEKIRGGTLDKEIREGWPEKLTFELRMRDEKEAGVRRTSRNIFQRRNSRHGGLEMGKRLVWLEHRR